MSGHDPLCPSGYPDATECLVCRCLRAGRADEREKIAQAIEAWQPPPGIGTGWVGWITQQNAARIAREGS